MPRKIVQGPLRDKQKTKKKLLAAVGEILKTKGYSGLMVSKIASVAGFDKKLIYEYFGSTDTLIDEYINSKDYWKEIDFSEESDVHSAGEELVVNSLVKQFAGIGKNEELQSLMIWQLSENRSTLKKIYKEREKIFQGLDINNSLDLEKKTDDYKAIIALLLAGIYHLNLHTLHSDTTFCGIDMKSPDGQKKIEKAIMDIHSFANENK
jgi:AcrR family transcriptional regulator